jgi:hypothetical protein
MNTIIQNDTNIQDITSIVELFIKFICTQKIITISGIHIAIQEFRKNLHLMTACLSNHLIVNQKFERDKLILFITASHAE